MAGNAVLCTSSSRSLSLTPTYSAGKTSIPLLSNKKTTEIVARTKDDHGTGDCIDLSLALVDRGLRNFRHQGLRISPGGIVTPHLNRYSY